jgi:hypothetical protein
LSDDRASDDLERIIVIFSQAFKRVLWELNFQTDEFASPGKRVYSLQLNDIMLFIGA